jgi:hypothetical protein
MRATKDDRSSDNDVSAVHQALLNQCRKSSTPSSLESNLPKCKGSASANAMSTVELPTEIANALFDALGLAERALREQYTCCLRDFYPCTFEDEPGAVAITLGFDDSNDVRRFYLQGFVRPDGTIAASGKLEPKFFLDDDMIAYRPARPMPPIAGSL